MHDQKTNFTVMNYNKESRFIKSPSYLTLIPPACARMLLNMVLQTKYEDIQEIVPSVPVTEQNIVSINAKVKYL